MTATPIPRTLQMSLSGIRDLNVTTPPVDRLSVRTYVCRATDEVVRDAILRMGRGGQVFFVHRVQSIQNRAEWLASLVPRPDRDRAWPDGPPGTGESHGRLH